MDRVTRAKIDSLVYALRTTDARRRLELGDLARRFQLDPMIVVRVAESEGCELDGLELDEPEPAADPTSATEIIDANGDSVEPGG